MACREVHEVVHRLAPCAAVWVAHWDTYIFTHGVECRVRHGDGPRAIHGEGAVLAHRERPILADRQATILACGATHFGLGASLAVGKLVASEVGQEPVAAKPVRCKLHNGPCLLIGCQRSQTGPREGKELGPWVAQRPEALQGECTRLGLICYGTFSETNRYDNAVILAFLQKKPTFCIVKSMVKTFVPKEDLEVSHSWFCNWNWKFIQDTLLNSSKM